MKSTTVLFAPHLKKLLKANLVFGASMCKSDFESVKKLAEVGAARQAS